MLRCNVVLARDDGRRLRRQMDEDDDIDWFVFFPGGPGGGGGGGGCLVLRLTVKLVGLCSGTGDCMAGIIGFIVWLRMNAKYSARNRCQFRFNLRTSLGFTGTGTDCRVISRRSDCPWRSVTKQFRENPQGANNGSLSARAPDMDSVHAARHAIHFHRAPLTSCRTPPSNFFEMMGVPAT